MHWKSLQEERPMMVQNGVTSRLPTIQGRLIFAACVLLSGVVHAMATLVTLPELIQKSQVIVYGHLDQSIERSSSPVAPWLRFKTLQVLKGTSSVKDGIVVLCNSRPPQGEWADLSKLSGDSILFLTSKDGACFDVSHSYRSVVAIRDGQASTVTIKGQPKEQPLELFLQNVRTLVSKQPQTASK
jgi:hypothetical protein